MPRNKRDPNAKHQTPQNIKLFFP